MTEDLKLPEGWKLVKLGEVAERIKEVHPKGSQPYLEIGDVDIKSKRYAIKEKPSPEHCLRVRKNYIVISKVRPMRGAIAKIKEEYLYVSPALLVLNSDNNDFLFYALSKEDFFNYLGTRETGTTYPSVNDSDVLDFEFLLPSISEQRKIAEIMENVDETIEKTDAIIEKYKRIKQGLMQDLLTRGITAFEFEKDKLIADIKKVFDSGDHRFGREENLVSHLSRHLENFFPEWDVDNEVEKNNERQRPDIIVHKRGMDKNLFAIEVKKNENLNAIKLDIEKLEDVMLGDYHYEDAVFIGFYIENFEAVFKLSEKVNFILVPKNGEIKVKSHVRRFKDSPLGKIPEDWEVVKLGEVATILLSNVDKKIFPQEIKVKLCNYLEVYKHDYIFTNVNFSIGSVNIREYQKFRVDKGDVIITKDSEEFDDIAKSAYVGDEIEDLICGYHLCLIKPKINIIAGQYLAMVLWFEKYNKQFQNKANGITRFGISKETIENALLPLPSLPEQHRIALILSQMDETIEEEQNYKEKFERIKQGLIENLLTGKVRVNHLIKEGVESV